MNENIFWVNQSYFADGFLLKQIRQICACVTTTNDDNMR